MKKLTLTLISLLVGFSLQAQVNARLMRYPDVSETHITFVYGDDVWIVPKSGGTAIKLSSPAGEGMFPRFSPDGNHIAFTANYDGNSDVYVMEDSGGDTQKTHLPRCSTVPWTGLLMVPVSCSPHQEKVAANVIVNFIRFRLEGE